MGVLADVSKERAYKIRLVPITEGQIEELPWNPPERVARKNIAGLIRSIAETGLLYPLLVQKTEENGKTTYTLVDGHRRAKALRILDFARAPALIINGEISLAEVYSTNDTARKFTGRDQLYIFLQEPTALSTKLRVKFGAWQETYGRTLLERVLQSGQTPFIFALADRIGPLLAPVLSKPTAEARLLAAEWLLHKGNTSIQSLLIADSITPEQIADLVSNGTPLKEWGGYTAAKNARKEATKTQ